MRKKGNLKEAIALAISLLRIPRLFMSLLLFPLLLSLVILFVQLLASGIAIQTMSQSPEAKVAAQNESANKSVLRELIYGDSALRPPLKVCRWLPDPNYPLGEAPPEGCDPDRLDAALHVAEPATYESDTYEKLLKGNFDRLHICKSACTPDVIIIDKEGGPRSSVGSPIALLLLKMTFTNTTVQKSLVAAAQSVDHVGKRYGNVTLAIKGFQNPVPFTSMNQSIILLCNIALLLIIGMYLALKAHRNVLDYFARNGALLPMVAATGAPTFYLSIWTITLIRVGAFLLASFPILIIQLSDVVSTKAVTNITSSPLTLGYWFFTLAASIALTTLISSIAELKRRHSLTTFLYRYAPLFVAMAGAALWLASLFFESGVVFFVRHLVTACPVVGLAPLLISPLFQPPSWVFLVHFVGSIIGVYLLQRSNSRWFSAHVEEL